MLRPFPWLADTGAAEDFPDRASGGFLRGCSPSCLLFPLSFDSRHGAGACHPGLAVPGPDGGPGRTGGDRPVAMHRARDGEGVPTRSGGLTLGKPVGEEQADVVCTPGHPGCRPADRRGALRRRCHRDRVGPHDADHGSELSASRFWPTARVVLLGLASIAFTAAGHRPLAALARAARLVARRAAGRRAAAARDGAPRGLDPAEPHGQRRARQARRPAHGAVPRRPSRAWAWSSGSSRPTAISAACARFISPTGRSSTTAAG